MKKLSKRLYNLKQRCNNPNCQNYKHYGGKGIKCLLTLKDLAFLWERDHAENMINASVGRIDSNGDYELSNCRFVELIDNIRQAASDRRGISLEEYNKKLKKCLNCGSYNGYVLASGAKFCRKCGAITTSDGLLKKGEAKALPPTAKQDDIDDLSAFDK